jgi:hypothetical protein
MKIIKLYNDKHKYQAVFSDGKKQKFGWAGMNDYTITGDMDARNRYRARHGKDLDTQNPRRAGFLSYYILWGDSQSIDANIRDYKKKFSSVI